MSRFVVLVIGFAVSATLASAENWPGFRGPTGCGNSSEKNLPLEWNAKTGRNIRWSVDSGGEGTAGPIVWNDRVFVANVAPGDDAAGSPRHQVACFRAKDGELLWRTAVAPGPFKRGGLKGGRGSGYANAVPCTDGERVYALFGSSTIVAVDFAGKEVWRRDLKPHSYNFEMATCPVIHGDAVIVFCGMNPSSRLIAFHRATGETIYDKALKDTGYAHSTPILVDVKGRRQMLIAASGKKEASNAIQAFDPATGEKIWWAAGIASTASPIVARDCVYFDSGRGGLACFVDLFGTGDVGTSRRKWTAEVPECLGSPIAVGDHLYRLHNGVVHCRGLDDGKKVYQERTGASSSWASPVADADGHIFFASGGKTAVLKAGPKFELVSLNDLGDAAHGSAAIANGCIYILGDKKLWCIGR